MVMLTPHPQKLQPIVISSETANSNYVSEVVV